MFWTQLAGHWPGRLVAGVGWPLLGWFVLLCAGSHLLAGQPGPLHVASRQGSVTFYDNSPTDILFFIFRHLSLLISFLKFINSSISPSVYMSVCPSVHLPIYPSVSHLSISFQALCRATGIAETDELCSLVLRKSETSNRGAWWCVAGATREKPTGSCRPQTTGPSGRCALCCLSFLMLLKCCSCPELQP